MYLLKNNVRKKIQIFTKKHKISFLLFACVSAVLILFLLCSNTPTWQSDSTQLTKNPIEPLAYTCCTPLNNSFRTNVYFIKTHKTGSTTVENLILRFALMNSLDVMNIIYTTYYLPFSEWSIYSHTRPPNNKYHILAHHVRYDSKLKSYQYPDTSTVTILRHPVSHFKSKYDFFQLNLLTGMNLEQFLNAPIKPPLLIGMDSFMAYRGYNQMSVDLGFDLNQSKNQTAIAEFIEKIDREFDLVMIMEYMEASIILLANLMGWPLETVAHLKMISRVPDSDSNTYNLTIQDEFTIMNLNEVDTQLYHHFRNKFLKCVRQYGEKRMNDQIQQLRVINQRFFQRCVSDDTKYFTWYGSLKTIEYTPKNQSDLECVYATTNPIVLEDIVRNEQFDRLQRQRKR